MKLVTFNNHTSIQYRALLCFLSSLCFTIAHEPAFSEDGITPPDDLNQIEHEMLRAGKEVPAHVINHVHRRLISSFGATYSEKMQFEIRYCGIAAWTGHKQIVHKDGGLVVMTGGGTSPWTGLGSDVSWDICLVDDKKFQRLTISLWVSMRKTEQTRGEFKVDGRTVYVNCSDNPVSNGELKTPPLSVNAELPQFGSKSVHQIVQVLCQEEEEE